MMNKNDEHKELILDFRKNFQIALDSNHKKTKLYKQMDLSADIAIKILSDPIESIVMRNSTRGKIQDFNKWTVGLNNGTETEGKKLMKEELDDEYYKQFPDEKPNTIMENAMKNPKPAPPVLEEPTTTHQAITKGNDDMPNSLRRKTVGDPLTDEELEFFRKLGEAHKAKPNNCVITVNLY